MGGDIQRIGTLMYQRHCKFVRRNAAKLEPLNFSILSVAITWIKSAFFIPLAQIYFTPKDNIFKRKVEQNIAHTIEKLFSVIGVVISYSKGQKQLKNALHPKNILARPTINDGLYPEKIWIASPGNTEGVTKLASILLFLQPDKSHCKSRQVLREPIF